MTRAETELNDIAEIFVRRPRSAGVRTFQKLSVKLILSLEDELHEIERRILQGPPCDGPVPHSEMTAAHQLGPIAEQIPIPDDAPRKLIEYYDLLLRFIKVYSLRNMDHIDRSSLRNALAEFLQNRPTLPSRLQSVEQNTDFVSLFTNHIPKPDRFTRLTTKFAFWLMRKSKVDKFCKMMKRTYFRVLGQEEPEDDPSFTTNEQRKARAMAVANVFIVSVINLTAMFILYAIHSTWARVGAISGFSFLFTLAVVIFTTAEPAIIYTSTAAYSAVLVVFIGSVN